MLILYLQNYVGGLACHIDATSILYQHNQHQEKPFLRSQYCGSIV